MRRRLALVFVTLVNFSVMAQSQQTKYKFDAKGRVSSVDVVNSTAPAQLSITYDAAGNRLRYEVSGATTAGGDDVGATVPKQAQFVIVPLNGFTLIPIN